MDNSRLSLAVAYVVILLCSVMSQAVLAGGVGKAFPVESENFAIENFQRVNPSLEWDPTNFLTDLSGNYATCHHIHQKGEMQADRNSPEGLTVTVVIDTTEGRESDVSHVNNYISDVITRWMYNRQHHVQMMKARRVGCSVRAACSGYAVITCAFSSGVKLPPQTIWTRPPQPIWTPYPTRRSYPAMTTRIENDAPRDDDWWLREKPKALAFTADQYRLAESMMGKRWDRSHFIENLSGFETDCAMTGRNDWPFDQMQKMSREQNIKLTGQYGVADNLGSTEDAILEIMRQFKPVTHVRSIGCSVIPHCYTSATTMKVVVACLYEEQ